MFTFIVKKNKMNWLILYYIYDIIEWNNYNILLQICLCSLLYLINTQLLRTKIVIFIQQTLLLRYWKIHFCWFFYF